MTNEMLANDLSTCARRLGTSKATLWRLIGANQIRSFQIGKKRYISEEELQRFIKAQERVADAQTKAVLEDA